MSRSRFLENQCLMLALNWLCRIFRAGHNGIILARSSSVPQRPYIARLSALSLFICASTGPLLQGSVIALRTASMSRLMAFANLPM